MFSQKPGASISPSEVSAIGRFGFWLLCQDTEYSVPFEAYPVFRDATIEQLYAMEEIAPGQLRWEALDADLELEALTYPEKFPLKYVA